MDELPATDDTTNAAEPDGSDPAPTGDSTAEPDVSDPAPTGDSTVELPAMAMAGGAVATDAIGSLARRLNLLIGLLALVLVGALVTIALLFSRVASAEDDTLAARAELAATNAELGSTRTELATTRDDLDRVEAGAALYASQITGFQELLVELEPQVSAGVDEAIDGLRTFSDSTIAFDVNIDEVIPIETEVVIKRTVAVPIRTSIPINETIETTIEVDTGIGFSVPIDVTVPVDLDVPIDLTVDIPIDETVPISEAFPVQLDVPIAIDVRETELAALTDSLAAGLESLQEVLTGLGG